MRRPHTEKSIRCGSHREKQKTDHEGLCFSGQGAGLPPGTAGSLQGASRVVLCFRKPPLAVGESGIGGGAQKARAEGGDRVKDRMGRTLWAALLGETAVKLSPCPPLAPGWGPAVSTSSALSPQPLAVTSSPRKHPL